MSNLDDLAAKIEAARQSDQSHLRNQKLSKKDFSPGAQAATEFAACILVAPVMGYYLDQWWGTQPILLISMFFLGVAAGFWALFKYAKLQSGGVKNSGLPEVQKDAKKANLSVLETRNTEHKKDE